MLRGVLRQEADCGKMYHKLLIGLIAVDIQTLQTSISQTDLFSFIKN